MGEPVAAGATLRPTARVLLVDAKQRALLFRMRSEDFGDTFWFPPGGGLEGGETHEEAALRELQEETGWADPVLGPLIGTRRHVITWGGVLYDCRERWYLARVGTLVVDTAGFTDDERHDMLESRWWSVDRMRSTTDRLVPADLPDLLEALLRDGPPATPLSLST
ncbi:MAG: NUDIX domain-containing protein [Actinobacteria bacterium]|nr:NUDIX domain-containing protein [Actinomycetota bacterium]